MNFVTAFTLLCVCGLALSQTPWKNCGEFISNLEIKFPQGQPTDHLKITKLTVTPYPPKIGGNLTVLAEGSSDEVISSGSGSLFAMALICLVLIDLAFDGITLLNSTFDLCSLIHGVDVNCPLAKGPLKFTVVQSLPNGVPAVRIL